MFGRARLTLAGFYAAVMAVTILAIGAVAYVVISHSLDDEINSAIRATATGVLHDPGRFGSLLASAPPDHGRDGDESGTLGISSDVFFISTDQGGAVIANPRRIDVQHRISLKVSPAFCFIKCAAKVVEVMLGRILASFKCCRNEIFKYFGC